MMTNETILKNNKLCTVVIVDDEAHILQSLQRLFRKEDYTVVCATSGHDALKLLPQLTDVAVIISDQRMPVMEGSEFLRLSRETAPDATRIILTGYSDIKAAIAAINEGGTSRYVTKPWNDSELLQTVRYNVRNYNLLKETHRQQEIINSQNIQLLEWNTTLKQRVLQHTNTIRSQMTELQKLSKKQQKTSDSMISILTELIEMRSPSRRRHADNTMTLTVSMARRLALPAEELEQIRLAALLHDIGKNVLADSILAKESIDLNKLNFDEKLKYEEHPVLGQTALEMVEELRPVGLLVRHHHENWDGSGYPDRLAGESIPLGSRLIAIADTFDVEISRRPESGGLEKTLKIIARRVGTRFSPGQFPLLEQAAHELYDEQYELARQECAEVDPTAHQKPGTDTDNNDRYHLVTVKDEKTDTEEIIKLFSGMAEGVIECDIRLINYIDEMPLSYDAKIVALDGNRIELKVHENQAMVMQMEKQTIIRSNSFLEGLVVHAKISYINVIKKTALLQNFRYACIPAARRGVVRVKLAETCPVTFVTEIGCITGSLIDISGSGVSIIFENRPDIPLGQQGQLSFMLVETPMRIPAITVKSVLHDNSAITLIFKINLGKMEDAAVNRFIYQRQVEIIRALKEQFL